MQLKMLVMWFLEVVFLLTIILHNWDIQNIFAIILIIMIIRTNSKSFQRQKKQLVW